MSVHPPRETKTRRGADRRALGGTARLPLWGCACPLMGKIISLLGFWGFSGGVRRRPQTTQTVFGETVERQDSDEAQTKGKTRMVKFITIRGTRAPPRLSAPASLSVRPSASRLPPPHRFAHIADFACENGHPSSPSRIRFCPMRFHCVIISEVSIQRLRTR